MKGYEALEKLSKDKHGKVKAPSTSHSDRGEYSYSDLFEKERAPVFSALRLDMDGWDFLSGEDDIPEEFEGFEVWGTKVDENDFCSILYYPRQRLGLPLSSILSEVRWSGKYLYRVDDESSGFHSCKESRHTEPNRIPVGVLMVKK